MGGVWLLIYAPTAIHKKYPASVLLVMYLALLLLLSTMTAMGKAAPPADPASKPPKYIGGELNDKLKFTVFSLAPPNVSVPPWLGQ